MRGGFALACASLQVLSINVSGTDGAVFEVPFVGQASDATMIADSFESFASGANPDFIDQRSRLIS